MSKSVGRIIVAVGLAALGYLLIYRPLQLRWGATQEEVRRAMPGDGWHGYDWIDNDGIPSSPQILPNLQQLKVGDPLPVWRNIEFPVTALLAWALLWWAIHRKRTAVPVSERLSVPS